MTSQYKNISDEKAKQVADFYLKNKEMFDKINQNEVESDFKPIKGLYIDVVLIKDFRMGLLLNLFPSDKLLPNLKKWNMRPQRTWTKPYAELNLSNEQLQEMYLDEKNHLSIVNKSPDTSLMNHIHDFILNVLIQNSRSGYNHKIPLYFNTYPISTNNELLQQFLDYLISPIPEEVLIFQMCMPSKDIPKKCLTDCDLFIIDDLIAHVDPKASFHEALFINNEMVNKTIIAVPQIEDDKLITFEETIDIWAPNEMEDFLMPTNIIFNTLCNFSYSWFPIPMPDGTDPFPPPSMKISEKTDISGKFKKDNQPTKQQ